jgi:hypothetical protein
VTTARIATTLEETDIFPDVRERFERACKITDRKRTQLLRVMVAAWLSQWEAAGSHSDYLGYAKSAQGGSFLCPGNGAPWDPNTVIPHERHSHDGDTLADVVPFRPRLVPPPEAAA